MRLSLRRNACVQRHSHHDASLCRQRRPGLAPTRCACRSPRSSPCRTSRRADGTTCS
ncbi:Hypothetical protein A7982_10735 [Minicystis rosea]|nr:Hypothetical protein A7982_10735 [Minicystis rosea]